MKINRDVDLSPQTTFKIGGKANYFVEVENRGDLEEATLFAQENDLEIFILGGGSNVLISDKGFQGLVIKIANSKIPKQITRKIIKLCRSAAYLMLIFGAVK